MKTICLLIFILFSNVFFAFSQENDIVETKNLVSDFVKELQKTKIDTICIFEDYTIGHKYYPVSAKKETYNDCFYNVKNQPSFLIWKENGNTYFTKINLCNEYSIVQIDAEHIWNFILQNQKTIKNEKIKGFQLMEFINGAEVILEAGIDHSLHQNFKLIINQNIIEQHLDHFYFSKFGNNKKVKNINFEHNKNLKSKILVDELDKLFLRYSKDLSSNIRP